MADNGRLMPEMASTRGRGGGGGGSGDGTGSSSSASITRPSLIHSVSCPDNLPQLTITTSDDPTHPTELHIPGTPSTKSRLDEDDSDSSSTTTATDNENVRDAESDIDNIEKPKRSPSVSSKVEQVLSNDKDSADTLVEAVLDKAEAQDRHVRFQDHVLESAALVESMLNRRGATDDQSSERMGRRFRRNSAFNEDEMIEDGDTAFSNKAGRDDNGSSSDGVAFSPSAVGGGSVLASLMKLEAQRRHNEEKELERKHRKQKKKESKKARSSEKKNKNKPKRPASLYNIPFHSSTDPLSTPPKRPKMVNRPCSWLSTVTASNHLVPSLEKKKLMPPSVSRRSSVDSMLTTASQFEPITLEDRIRITFEIANILQKQEFLRKLARCLMLYGCPAHRLEYAMRQVSKTIGVDAEYIYFPNVMFVTFFDQSTHTTETHFIRQSQTFEMHKLAEIYRLEKLVAHGEVSVDEALEFIDKVANEPRFYPLWMNPFVYALASFCGCLLFFAGSWADAGVSAALAMVFAIYEFVSGRVQSLQAIWEITVCILIGFVAKGVTKYGFCFTPIAFSAFIVILPGYPMAVAVVELVSRQLVSGVVRMVYSIIYAFLLGYGIQMGSELYLTIDRAGIENINEQWTQTCNRASNMTSCEARIPQGFFGLLVPLFAVAYCVFVRARPFRWPTMIVVSAIGYVVNYALSCYAEAPSQVLQVVPAFTIGFIGNLLTKITGKMSFDAVLLGVFYLVPGGLGIKAGYGMFDNSNDSLGTQGANLTLAMIESSIGITIGLFVATLIVYPKGAQHTPLMNF